MMKRIKNIFKLTLVTALLLTTLSGAVAVQAAGPGGPKDGGHPRIEERDHGGRDRGPDHDRYRDDHKDPKEEVDSANKKANWALGVAAVAAVIAITK